MVFKIEQITILNMKDIFYFKEYLPKRYMATPQQVEDRESCYSFKNGVLDISIENAFLSKLSELIGNDKANWVICFIPASSALKTRNRYSNLASAISDAGYKVSPNTIFNKYDREAGHVAGKTNNPIESFGFNGNLINGKNVVVIDDIITRGTTFGMTSLQLKLLGAKCVKGLFLAKTINPDYVMSHRLNDAIPTSVIAKSIGNNQLKLF